MAGRPKRKRVGHERLLGVCNGHDLERMMRSVEDGMDSVPIRRRQLERELGNKRGALTECVMLATTDGDWEWTFLEANRLL